MATRVVNVIPNTLSDETRQDSEASVTANPADPRQIALSAFTSDPAGSGSAPIFVSTDGGATWALNVCVPGGNMTGDISLRFSGSDGRLYGGILRADNGRMDILRAPSFPPVGLMTVLIDRAGPDQPWVEAAWAGAGGNTTRDRVYVTANTGTAEAQFSLDAGTAGAPAGFGAAVDIEARAGSDRPSVRTAVHRAGVVYATFIGVRAGGSDVVVVRDDDGGNGGWAALVDPGDGVAGRRVVTGVTVPPVGTLLGSVRVSSRIAIAVDPRNRRRVYLAWCDGMPAVPPGFRLHLRRSDDGGATWTGDLRTIDQVTNPGLAVNVRGTVGLLYQRLTTPAGGNRFETHLEISVDRFATVRTDLTLANLPDLGGTFQPTIGDYANLIAVGKDFHAAFCGFNQPVAANFPQGVTYLRNADFPNQRLLGNDGVTVRANSIDPFYAFFSDVAPEQDVFVRDWTDSPTVFDTGVEPSIRPAFWAVPDVWNRRGTLPGPFPNDQPSNEPAGNGVGNLGDNWAFARVRRRRADAAGAAVAATAHFLVSPLGTGSNFLDASSADPDVAFPDPDPTVNFAPADAGPITTVAFPWHLNPVASTHLCLAVELSSPGDPFAGQSLRGRAPGWPDQDLEILDDNNKAQRNMGLSTTPARGVEAAETCLCGLVHNAATFRRDVVIGYALDGLLQRVETVGLEGLNLRKVRAKPSGTLTLKAMEPGENRWIAVSFVPPAGRAGDVARVDFAELVNGMAVNGFSLGTRLADSAQTVVYVLERHRSVFTRAAALGVAGADDEVKAARTAQRKPPTAAVWVKGVQGRFDRIAALLVAAGVDKRRVDAAKAVLGGKPADAIVALGCLLERADMAITMRVLEPGNRGDILQTARWHAELFDRDKPFGTDPAAAKLSAPAVKFVAAYGARKAGDAEYVTLLRGTQPSFAALKRKGDAAAFERLVGALQQAVERGDVAGLQGTHRALLLHLQAVADG
ncbi:hypothetical protein [Solirubrobacter soli]|uniref:hypothetical protein n=1 Tax=Solirubrobacter soli TaxID=363832 RepID=UPI000423E342|nr:hypothetical protein [Solirubrobacter soli]